MDIYMDVNIHLAYIIRTHMHPNGPILCLGFKIWGSGGSEGSCLGVLVQRLRVREIRVQGFGDRVRESVVQWVLPAGLAYRALYCHGANQQLWRGLHRCGPGQSWDAELASTKPSSGTWTKIFKTTFQSIVTKGTTCCRLSLGFLWSWCWKAALWPDWHNPTIPVGSILTCPPSRDRTPPGSTQLYRDCRLRASQLFLQVTH